jgi:hypothetical protein
MIAVNLGYSERDYYHDRDGQLELEPGYYCLQAEIWDATEE